MGFLPPPVLKVISCDYVSVHPGLSIMGGVECFRVFARPFDFLFIECLQSGSCQFSLRIGAIHTSGQIRTDWNEIKGEIL